MNSALRACCLVFVAVSYSSGATDWSCFRGSGGSGVSSARNLPEEFGPDRNLIWKTATPAGKSSPILGGDRLYLTGHNGDERYTLCLDRHSGRLLWKSSLKVDRQEQRNRLNDAAAPTPVFDGENVYAFFADYGLVSYDTEGHPRWRVPLGPFFSEHGIATSPVIAGNSVVLQIDQFRDSFLAAFSTEDGALQWKKERPSVSGAYSTPALRETPEGSLEIVVSAPYELAGYDANTGDRVWWVGGLAYQPKSVPVIGKQRAFVVSAGLGGTPPPYEKYLEKLDQNGDGLIAVEEGQNPSAQRMLKLMDRAGGNDDGVVTREEWMKAAQMAGSSVLVAVRLGGSGDLTESGVMWKHSKQLPVVPSPLLYEDVVYLIKNSGIATTLIAETGKVLCQKRLAGAVDSYYSSPIVADGKIYVASEHGKVVVMKAVPELDVLAINDLGEDCYATPAVADGRLYVRTSEAQYCFGKE